MDRQLDKSVDRAGGLVSLLFGLAHAMTTSYFVIASLVGAYLGWLAMTYADLIAPIIAHALYDFVAILYFRYRIDCPRS